MIHLIFPADSFLGVSIPWHIKADELIHSQLELIYPREGITLSLVNVAKKMK